MDKRALVRNFSRYADRYDRYADVQRLSAVELLGRIGQENPDDILEIGCGTGNYTELIRRRFRGSKIQAIDISPEMIKVAEKKLTEGSIEFIVADAEEIFLEEKFDLVTSNACFQWFGDLPGALGGYKDLLRPGGEICFSIFGPLTFWELNLSLKYIFKDAQIEAARFLSRERVNITLGKIFKDITVEELKFEKTYDCLRGLLNRIKYTGTRGNSIPHEIYLKRSFLEKLEGIYLDKFKSIKATYQVFFCRCLKK